MKNQINYIISEQIPELYSDYNKKYIFKLLETNYYKNKWYLNISIRNFKKILYHSIRLHVGGLWCDKYLY